MFKLSVLLMALLSAAALAAESATKVAAPQGHEATSSADEVEKVDESKARIYRTVDEQGRPLFTDAPDSRRPNEEVQIREGSTVKMVRPKTIKSAPEQVASTAEYEVAISAPADGETLSNPEAMNVTITVVPAPAEEHSLRLLDNGEQVPVLIEWPDRGEHRLVAQVVDQDGQVLAESKPVVVYVQRVSLLNKIKN